jgi:predicted nucleotidyltransferase
MVIAYDIERELPRIVDRIVVAFNPVKIILFGSRARGDGRPDSDVDLLIVLDQMTNHHDAAAEVRSVLTDLIIPTDVIVTTPQEIELRGNVIGSVLRPALAEGRVLHER